MNENIPPELWEEQKNKCKQDNKNIRWMDSIGMIKWVDSYGQAAPRIRILHPASWLTIPVIILVACFMIGVYPVFRDVRQVFRDETVVW